MQHLSRNLVLFGVLLVGAVCFCHNSSGEEKTAAKTEKKKINLTPQEVDKCLSVLPEFIKDFPAFNPLSGAAAKSSGPPNVQGLISSANINKLNSFAAKNGYKDFNAFARNFTGVMSGYMYFKTKSVQQMFEEQAKNLPPETAAIMKTQMKPVEIALKKLEETVTPELLNAVKPHIAELDKIMGLP